ncbi:MAG: glutamine synthetase III [Clostridia bacterium]|nr:glutamine synthetase III [Clostridia bacterium]
MEDRIEKIFGSDVFNDKVMSERLPEDVYNSLKRTISMGRSLNISVANAVAGVMKDWAVENGATHYTHWFQPMTGITAEKHDSFVSPLENGTAISDFSGKQLIKGEPDASSFPSGGLRATFEARGYTAWDPTSYAFIKNNVLCIPTVFCSYSGESLDKKTPLLRSIEVIGKQALRILRLFGDEKTKRVVPSVGAEQEYFLIRKEDYMARRDLLYTGRTLFGARPPKGQQLNDHYFGSIKPKVKEFMRDLDEALWRLGVCAKTEHNEAAPAQHELAPLYSTVNTACDHNQIMMDTMKRVASEHGLICLLNEKPFEGVNGSGKHNNWSLTTDDGQNLLDPGSTPSENAQFLVFLAATIAAVDDYQDILRISVATAGNDLRLGAAEAPPAIISMFLGDELTAILESIESGSEYHEEGRGIMEIGVHVLPKFPKDTSDRNRTSPFAFTGNKFEFRMPGSALSIAGPNTVLNTIVAEELSRIADELEGVDDFNSALNRVIRRIIKEHKRIIYSGNGYTKEWEEEAKRRGLSHYRTLPDALEHICDEKNVELFEKHHIYTEKELSSRREILLENYATVTAIEADTMVDMINKEILPASVKYAAALADSAMKKKRVSENISVEFEETLLTKLSSLNDSLYSAGEELAAESEALREECDHVRAAAFCRDKLIPAMKKAREFADEIERCTDRAFWPYPTYGDILFGIH